MNLVVDALADPLRGFVAELLTSRGIPHNPWNPDDTALPISLLAPIANELPGEDRVAAYRTCLIDRNTGRGTAAFLRSGFAAALAINDQLALVAAHLLAGDREPIWSDTAVVLRDSEAHEAAARRLVEGWRENFGKALAAFVARVSG